jgi:adenosylmethionine-8-amino-7-oxononanoate aminotransferase
MDHEAAVARHLWIHESSPTDLYERDTLRIFRRGEGSWLIDARGDRYLDLCSSMWQAGLGHGRSDIVAAYTRQAELVASAGPIWFTTEGAAELAERLARSAPGDLSRCFLTSSGSEATETAIKLARQYHRIRGEPHRYKFISRYGSYHGAGMGGTSIGGRRRRDHLYYPLMPGTVNIAPPTGSGDLAAAEALRTAIEMEGPETVAAFIGEPVAIMQFTIPDADYWPRVREICDEYGVLMIADETLTGCCRTGRFWGVQNWNVVPDVLVAAKAVSSGYAPVAAMIVRDTIYDAFSDGVPSPSVQSYGGHGASAAAAARAFEVYEDERMDEIAERRGADLEARLDGLRAHPIVRDIRRIGLWLAIELQHPRTGQSLARGLFGKWEVGPLLSRTLLAHGCAAARMSEGLLHIAPPYVATDGDLDFIADRVAQVLDAVTPQLARIA